MRRFGGMIGKGIVAIALIALAAPASASVKDGVDAWSRGDYAAAVKQWQGPADSGDADAQFNLAQAYKLGRGVRQDMKKAEELYRKAAEQGHMRATDTYGLLLFEQGRRQEAMPWIEAAARRGEPRAQYVLGIAAFNGDLVGKDWVRAYALMTRAAAAGLPQATQSLSQMDTVIPLAQRQQGVSLAGTLDEQAQQLRDSQLAAADLGTPQAPSAASPAASASLYAPPLPRPVATTAVPPSAAARSEAGLTSDAAANPRQPVTAGADYANPVVLSSREHRAGNDVRVHPNQRPAGTPAPAPRTPAPATTATASATTRTPASPRPPAPRTGEGPWRVQLGAFGQPDNATALWNRVRGRPELAGRIRFNEPAGKMVRLQAGGFASEAEAARACAALKAGGFVCVPVKR